MARIEFEIGDKVLLQLGADGLRLAPRELKRWDGCQFVVAKKCTIGAKNGTDYYELASCKSSSGVPFAILPDWLLPMR